MSSFTRAPWLLLFAIACSGTSSPTTGTPATSRSGSSSPPRASAPAAEASAEDDCTKVTRPLIPVMNELTAGTGKTFGDAERAQQVAQCRDSLARGKRDPIMDCVLQAPDERAVRSCFEAALVAYRNSAQFGCSSARECMARAVELDATSPDRATDAYYGACTLGEVDGCEQAGLRWMKQADGTRPDPRDPQIVESWRRACDLGGGTHGCGNLGSAYYFGLWGTPVDADEGVRLWTTACKVQANKFSCRKLEQAKAGQITPGKRP